MTTKLLLGTALSALMLSGALAQAPSSNPPAATSSSPPAAATSSSPPAAATNDQASKSKPDFVMSQKPDQYLASKFKGTDVIGTDDKKIGDVTDILFDKDGKIEAYIVSVGGFLGMGSKDVALPPSAFDVVAGSNGGSDKLKLSMTQDQLKQAQNFMPYSPPRPTTTGAGPTGGGLGGPKPGGMGR